MDFRNDIDCSVTQSSQWGDSALYNYVCRDFDEQPIVDLETGDELRESHKEVIGQLNYSLGTEYELQSLVVTDCQRANGGICVLTPEPNGNYTLDMFKPGQTVGRQSTIVGSCFLTPGFDPLSIQEIPDGEEIEICEMPYQGINPIKGDIETAQEKIDDLRYKYEHPGISIILGFLHLWLGIGWNPYKVSAPPTDTTCYPEAISNGDTDGMTAPEEPANVSIEEPAEVHHSVTTKYPMQIFRTGGDGNTASRY